MGKPQYAWKQNGAMKRRWFPDKDTCLRHCERHKSDGPVHLYKRVSIPQGWVPFIVRSKADCWGTTHYLVMRRVLEDHQKPTLEEPEERPTQERLTLDSHGLDQRSMTL